MRSIHIRNKERLDRFTSQRNLRLREGNRMVTREVIMYSFRGLLEICMHSNQPVANQVIDKLWEVVDEIRLTGSCSIGFESQGCFAVDAAIRILSLYGLEDNQLTLALDKVYKRCAGFSLLETTGIQLTAPTNNALLTPTDIGKEFGMSAAFEVGQQDRRGATIANRFEIHIYGGQDGYLHWNTAFNEDNRLGAADIAYINSIACELAKALGKLQSA